MDSYVIREGWPVATRQWIGEITGISSRGFVHSVPRVTSRYLVPNALAFTLPNARSTNGLAGTDPGVVFIQRGLATPWCQPLPHVC